MRLLTEVKSSVGVMRTLTEEKRLPTEAYPESKPTTNTYPIEGKRKQ